MVEEGKIKVWMDRVDSRISIDASVRSSQDVCTVRIRDSHTHIVSIEKNGERVFKETEERRRRQK